MASWKFLTHRFFPMLDFDMHLLVFATVLSGLDLFVLSDTLACFADGPHYCPELCIIHAGPCSAIGRAPDS